MRVDPATGLLAGARYVPSPHQDDRPPGTEIELLVVHGISLPPGSFGGPWIERLFLGTLPTEAHPYFATINPRVSAHLLVRRSGRIVQYVPFHRRAWHAGASSWRGRERVNDFSVGVEVEGAESVPYEAAQYRALAAAVAALAAAWPALGEDGRVVSHAEVAPERKTDPWASFDWGRFRSLLAARRDQR
ncbi:MAG TPA: 1,6-anhydro-N-acetylmuramyl-L-alanine amidase AmpD [Thermoanaerobaculia bacterium]|nr:1,6-anhydro-N-acetylmuramyl-L-alanine amidase AmpD [Thermoanaerobaculia bacterium]